MFEKIKVAIQTESALWLVHTVPDNPSPDRLAQRHRRQLSRRARGRPDRVPGVPGEPGAGGGVPG